ncbi:PEGA domain-containing protein [Leptospira langatensis]|uniref:PEGA domain-containing protein n=1 Tax=Leptospira langatensis TaxID=2484983 RepID=A0A5F1ZTS4_9LEPT|nr:PEGA domain-containing protein [Leptospira langatensis]TGK03193.1 PEGA domain-containing protein [Leptospira langatensis]TGL41949.1 PEGA domain-containing protein [Leptospira langatensis]
MGTSSFRNLKLLSLIVILGSACSSVQKLDEPSKLIQEPYYKPIGESANVFIFRESESDFRVRKSGHEVPVIAFSPIEYPKSVDNKLASYFEQEISLIWKDIKYTNARISKDAWKSKEALSDELKKKDTDIVVFGSISESSSGWTFKFEIKDSVDDSKFGEFELSFKKPVSTEEVGNWTQAIFWKASDRIISLETRQTTVPVWDRKPDVARIKEIVNSSVKGFLNVRASSSDTEILWKGKSLGSTPLLDIPISEGIQEIQLVLKGKKPITKTVQVRAGKKNFLFHEWEEDKTLGSAKVISVPNGLSVSIDGYKQGETPFFRSNLTPGAYQLELLKESADGSYVYYEGVLDVKPDKVAELALPYTGKDLLSESEFWKPSGENGFSAIGPKGLEFAKKKNLPNGWNGAYSLPFIPEELELEGYFLLPVDHKEGSVAVTFHFPGLSLGLEAGKEKVSIFQFPSDGRTLGTYKYKDVDKDVGRPFSFRADPKSKKLSLYLGSDKVWEGDLPAGGLWTVSVLTRGEEFREKAPLKDLKILYKGYK